MNEPYVSIGDVAKHFAVHENTVRNWIRQEMIPKTAYMKASRVYRFKLSAVADALAGNNDPVQLELNLDGETK